MESWELIAKSTSTNPKPLANSSYPPLGPATIVQVTGITDVNGGQGGGTAQ